MHKMFTNQFLIRLIGVIMNKLIEGSLLFIEDGGQGLGIRKCLSVFWYFELRYHDIFWSYEV